MSNTITGTPGSKGVVRGTARLIVDLNEIGRMQPGDILVTKLTTPIWTPIIHASKAVITDIGGALSHAAIVCREYGIPAVVGTKNGTEILKDGQTIEVDGNTGTVTVLST